MVVEDLENYEPAAELDCFDSKVPEIRVLAEHCLVVDIGLAAVVAVVAVVAVAVAVILVVGLPAICFVKPEKPLIGRDDKLQVGEHKLHLRKR